MLKRILILFLILMVAGASPAGAIKYKGDLESNESVTLPEQSATPANPVAGKRKVYVKDDGNLYHLDSSGNETQVGVAALKNKLINGNFRLWQRGTSSASSGGYFTADRWFVTFGGGGVGTVSRQSFTLGQTDVPGEPEFFYRHDQTTAMGAAATFLRNRIEGVRTLAGQTATLSFWGKADAAKSFFVRMQQNFGGGGTPSGIVNSNQVVVNLTATWQKFTVVFTVPSISGKTLGTDGNDYIQFEMFEQSIGLFTLDMARIQVEKGFIATEFEERPLALELALAQRYYEKQTVQTVNGDVWITWHAVKRGTPTTSTTAGTLNNTTADGSRLNHNAGAATTLTASAEL